MGKPICIGTMPRSGGTWLYNAVRLLYIEAYGEKNVYGSEADGRDLNYDPDHPAEWHIIKSGNAYTWLVVGAIQIYRSWREDRVELLDSWCAFWRNMTQLPESTRKAASMQLGQKFHHWQQQQARFRERFQTVYAMRFESMAEDPKAEFVRVAHASRLPLTDEQIDSAYAKLVALETPPRDDDGHPAQDPVTLLWSHHCRKTYNSSPKSVSDTKRKSTRAKTDRSKSGTKLPDVSAPDDSVSAESEDVEPDTD